MSELEHGAMGEHESRSPHPKSERRPASVIGLSIVSALNIICLAFVAFHFVGHKSGTNQPPAGDQSTLSKTVSPMPSRPEAIPVTNLDNPRPNSSVGVLGNIDFAQTSKRVIAIASGIDEMTLVPPEQASSGSSDSDDKPRAELKDASKTTIGKEYWVQLGALSEKVTATSYWSHLAKKHKVLLSSQAPRYVGPETVGGSLYHLRVGPMAAKQAKKLCEGLQSEGADCFCVGPSTGNAS